MLVPIQWLKEYVTVNEKTDALADRMTMSGSKVEEVRRWGNGLEKLVIGRVETVEPHPDADKLVVAKVNVGGEEPLHIVTGAANVQAGHTVPIALEGTLLPNGVQINGAEFRGVASQGMMCSHDELGIPKHLIPEAMRDGIWILDDGEPGSRFIDSLPLVEDVIEFEITSNRPDCLSLWGIARETAATLETSMALPEIQVEEKGIDWSQTGQVQIDDPEGCSRYVARRIENIRIAQSPQWMQVRLMQAGVRPINNVVDVTNYVMLETGQPLHAFDASVVANETIVVRRAEAGEETTTLDGTIRRLTETMTLITDGGKVLGIAGVMGGENSEITENTRTIILESACFNGDRIRKTSQQLGLRTEASSRFEKGQDPEMALKAAQRACQLLEELDAGDVSPGVIDVYPAPPAPATCEVRPQRVNALLGTNLAPAEMTAILTRLEISAALAGDTIQAIAPTFRQDLTQEADFIEEIGRIYGFDRIQPTLMTGDVMVGGLSERQKREALVRDTMSAMGCFEAVTYSFVSPSSVDQIRLPEDSFKRDFVRLLNPLGDETSVMRTTLLPNMMDVLRRNVNRSVSAGRFYETGHVFYNQSQEEGLLPREAAEMVVGMYGSGNDFYAMKGILMHLCRKMGLKDLDIQRETSHPTFHPGRCAQLTAQGHHLATFGEIHPLTAENYELADQRGVLAELNLDTLLELAEIKPVYKQLPRYPAIVRDLAVVLDREEPARSVEEVIRTTAGQWLEQCRVFDVFQGAQVGEGKKSVAFTLTFRHPERTLKDGEVNEIYDAIVAELHKKLNATLRT